MITRPPPYNDWVHLGRLQNLKSLEFHFEISFKLLVDLFSENNVPVEHLSLLLDDPNPFLAHPHDYKHAQKLKSLKRMDIYHSDAVSLLILLETQPSLEEITLSYFNYDIDDVNVDLIKDIFLHGKNLTKLSIINLRIIDLDDTLDKKVIALDCGRFVNVEIIRGPELDLEIEFPELRIEFSYVCRLQSTNSSNN